VVLHNVSVFLFAIRYPLRGVVRALIDVIILKATFHVINVRKGAGILVKISPPISVVVMVMVGIIVRERTNCPMLHERHL